LVEAVLVSFTEGVCNAWPAGQKWLGTCNFVVSRKVEILNRVPILRGRPASCLIRRAWHTQLWPVDQCGYVHLARQSCMAAHPCFTISKNTAKQSV